MEALPPAGLVLLAGASAVEALRCIADRLLASAAIWALTAAGLLAAAAASAASVF